MTRRPRRPRERVACAGGGAFAFVLPYLPLLLAVRHPADGLRARSRVHQRHGRLGRACTTSSRRPPTTGSCRRSSTSSIYTSVWLSALVVLVVALALLLHGRAEPCLLDLPVPLLHPGRAGRRGVGPGLAVHARPVGEPWVVPAAPRARRRPVRPVDRARAPALHLRDDRVLDGRRRLDRRDVRRAEHHPERAGGGRAHRRGRRRARSRSG